MHSKCHHAKITSILKLRPRAPGHVSVHSPPHACTDGSRPCLSALAHYQDIGRRQAGDRCRSSIEDTNGTDVLPLRSDHPCAFLLTSACSNTPHHYPLQLSCLWFSSQQSTVHEPLQQLNNLTFWRGAVEPLILRRSSALRSSRSGGNNISGQGQMADMLATATHTRPVER